MLWYLNPFSILKKIFSELLHGLSYMMNSELNDQIKEIEIKKSGKRLLLGGFGASFRFSIILLTSSIPIFVVHFFKLADSKLILATIIGWQFLATSTLLVLSVVILLKRYQSNALFQSEGVYNYSNVDKFFHYLAFSTPKILLKASSIENITNLLVAKKISQPPIFITSLARGGTTALLNALNGTSDIATHTYRDMPFLTSPVLWNLLSGGKKRSTAVRERAHGDGLLIDLDTPEAFEEVVWKLLFPEKYMLNKIPLWKEADWNKDAKNFIIQHTQQIITARRLGSKNKSVNLRYCSKNNLNIARIPFLLKAFPDCKIIVPVRRPECHASSMLRQHQNFLELQRNDKFILRYMKDIGHFEFGLLHKPIEFPGFNASKYDINTPDYWLYYWIKCFDYLLNYKGFCIFLFQEDLRKNASECFDQLLDQLKLQKKSNNSTKFFRSSPDTGDRSVYTRTLLDQADIMYQKLG